MLLRSSHKAALSMITTHSRIDETTLCAPHASHGTTPLPRDARHVQFRRNPQHSNHNLAQPRYSLYYLHMAPASRTLTLYRCTMRPASAPQSRRGSPPTNRIPMMEYLVDELGMDVNAQDDGIMIALDRRGLRLRTRSTGNGSRKRSQRGRSGHQVEMR